MCPIFGTDISLDAANVERLYGKAGFFDCGHSLLGNELSGCRNFFEFIKTNESGKLFGGKYSVSVCP